MKIVIAPDSFKGSLSAMEVAINIEKGIKRYRQNVIIDKVPMADGGEGTVEALVQSTHGKVVKKKVKGPLLREVEAYYGILGDGETAVIEMASASGLPLIGVEERNPMKTTTYGTGELILDALDQGCRKFVIGLGGSATNDGGAGMMMALGVKLLDKDGKEIDLGGQGLKDLRQIDTSQMDQRLVKSDVVVACDVDNPLCGRRGASYVFGPQKGADGFMVEKLDTYLMSYGEIIKRDLNKDVLQAKGAGAAGGMGAAILAFLEGELKSGVDIVIEHTKLEEKIRDADLVFTGEGRMDEQTIYGKTPYGVAKIAKKYDVAVIGICGALGNKSDVLYDYNFDSIFSIIDKPMTLEAAIADTDRLLQKTSEGIMRTLLMNRKSI